MKELVGRRARILDASIPEIVGKTVKLLYVEADNTAIIGFHKDSRLGGNMKVFRIINAGISAYVYLSLYLL